MNKLNFFTGCSFANIWPTCNTVCGDFKLTGPFKPIQDF